MKWKIVSLELFLLLLYLDASSQRLEKKLKPSDVMINKVEAVVGQNLILSSDIENEFHQAQAQGVKLPDRCSIIEELLFNKLLVHQAEIDSITVNDQQVQQELDQRMRYYISQVGSEEKLEEFYGKTIAELKEDFRDDVKNLLLARTMQSKITGDTKVSPSEVRAYFNSLPEDSLPLIDAEYEIAQIIKKPGIDEAEKIRVREKLEAIRNRIVNGEDFSTLAVLYSDDTESAKRGGELGFVGRTDLVPEFSAEAFNLRGKEISRIVESPFGYHIIQLIARRGEMINVRHILMIPKPSQDNFLKAQRLLDSLRVEIADKKSISFEEAALRFSDDSESKNNGGIMFNPRQGNTRFSAEEMEPGLFFIVDKLKSGEVSPVSRAAGQDGKPACKLVQLKSRTQPHRANPRDDYQRLQQMALLQKQAKLVNDWVNKKRKTTFIKISGDYSSCRFKNQWTDTQQ